MTQVMAVDGDHPDDAGGDRGTIARLILDAWDSSVAVVDRDGDIRVVNDAWESFAAANGGPAIGVGANYFEVCERAAGGDPSIRRTLEGLRRVLDGGSDHYTVEYPCHSPTQERWFQLKARPVTVGKDRHLLIVHDDVSERRRLQDDMRARSLVLDEVDAAVVATDLAGVVELWNRAAERMYGWSAADAIGQPISELILVGDGDSAEDRSSTYDFHARLAAQVNWETQLTVRSADGTTFPAFLRNTFVKDQAGSVTGMVSVNVDLSARIAMEGQLARSNRELKAITNSIGDGLCTLDGDGRITYLNPEAQRLLDVYVTEALGIRFESWLRALDVPVDDRDVVRMVEAEKPTECLVLREDGGELPIEYIATPLVSANEPDPSGWVVVFRDISERRAREARMVRQVEQAAWLRRIHDALDHDGFVLHTQPIVDVGTGQVTQNELLIRMRDPDDPESLIPPGLFLPTAEELGLAPVIDRWVLRHAFELAAEGLPVQINLSATSLDDPALPQVVEQLLQETGADPTAIMFEITETALLASGIHAEKFALRVHDLGCKLALDDFGTGYGGFTYLKQLPIDELKIDIEFVRDAVTNPASRHVIDAVVSLARAFGLRTVGEGVEDQATLDLLRELGVDLVQGYFLGRPGPLDAQLTAAGGPDPDRARTPDARGTGVRAPDAGLRVGSTTW